MLGCSVWRVIQSPSPCCVTKYVGVTDTRVCTMGDRGTFIHLAVPRLEDEQAGFWSQAHCPLFFFLQLY